MAMSARRVLLRTALLGLIAVSALDRGATLQAQRRRPQGYIAGTVRSSAGPEAGVWVIAETKDLPTNFIKIVVTDDRGQVRAAGTAGGHLSASGCAATASSTRRPFR